MMQTEQKVVMPGNGTVYRIVRGRDADGTPWVAMPDFGVAAVMRWDGYVAERYVAEKLGRGLTDADVSAVAKALTEW